MFQETEAFSALLRAEFSGFILGTTLTVTKLMARSQIVKGMRISGPGVASGTVIVGTSTPRGGPGRYIVSVRQNVGTSGAPIPMRGTFVSDGRVPEPPPPPPPPSGGGPASTEHKEMLDLLQNENRTNMSELERLRAELSKSKSIQSTELAVIQEVDKYIGNMSLYRDDITQDLDKKVIPNLQEYRRSHERRKGPLDNLRLLIEAMNNRMNLYNKLAEDIKNGSGITVARIREEIASANSLVTKYKSAYNATGRADEVSFNVSQQIFAVQIQRPLPLLELPSSAGPGSSTNTSPSWGIPLTRSKNPALYDMIAAYPNPAIWEPLLKAYNPPFLFPTDLPTNTTTLPTNTTTLRSISGFSDYKGKIASWTESFAPFEN